MPIAPYADQPSFPTPAHNLSSTPSDLTALINAIRDAHARRGNPQPRTIWLPPLKEKIHFPLQATLLAPETTYFAVSDDPENQRHIPSGWNRREGNMIFVGTTGFGTTTALLSLATQYALNTPPEKLDIITLDFKGDDLAPLAELPHSIGYASRACGSENAYIRALTYLEHELNMRLQNPNTQHNTLVCIVDGFDILRDTFGTTQTSNGSVMDVFQRIYTEGRTVNILCAMSTSRTKSLIGKIGESTRQKWAFHLTELYDYSSLGKLSHKDAPPAIQGRCVNAITGLQTQILIPRDGFAKRVAHISNLYAEHEAKSDKIAPLPSLIKLDTITDECSFTKKRWRIPIAISEKTRTPASLESWQGEHIL
ncbi:MAG: hypothetical protein IKZ87_02090, partial [Actinomycetaceae bacterium]|nr:hypothetical protein [Actinomycetaceae bacterium]